MKDDMSKIRSFTIKLKVEKFNGTKIDMLTIGIELKVDEGRYVENRKFYDKV